MKTIPLTKGYFTIVDNDDYLKLAVKRWCSVVDNRNPNKVKVRPFRREGKKGIYLSIEIMDPPKGKQVDHINGNTLDNRKSNLRICTSAENQHNKGKMENNTTGYKGVSFDKRDGFYYSRIKNNGKRISLGRFKNSINAALIYDEMAVKLHGKFAKLNF